MVCTNAAAQAPAEAPPPAEAAPPAPPPPPYSLPWQLRPVAAATVLRSDTAFAFYENAAGESGFTAASMLLGSYKITPEFAPLVRLGIVSADPPEGTPVSMMNRTEIESSVSFINPVLGATYVLKLPADMKLAPFLGLTLPIGTGGGEEPDFDQRFANAAGVFARSAMDNAMFAVDYFTIFPGFGLSWVKYGLTVQVEATLLQLFRVRGNDMVQPDESRTNLTMGAHAGYFFIPQLSIGTELRYQRWLSTPAAVKANSAARDTTTFAAGLRGHFKLGETLWLRPGIAYAIPLDDPMAAQDYDIVQLDIPVVF